jgi:hypothetical protein
MLRVGRKRVVALCEALIASHLLPDAYTLLDRELVLELREFLLMASQRMRWLLVAVQRTTGILNVFDPRLELRRTLYADLAPLEHAPLLHDRDVAARSSA